MRCSLFGKVPSKRDFVAPHAPRDFLNVWEPWLQGGMSASRQSLGHQWQDAFLKAPIWRFWLGADLCGTTVIGALMPSLDGVGRYFPLTVFACAEEGAAIAPPELDPQEAWFATAEDFLLSTLEPDMSFEQISAGLDQLPSPSAPVAGSGPAMPLPGGMITRMEPGEAFPGMFAQMRVASPENTYSAATFWWTIGGEGYEPFAVSARRMPDPFLFTEMLTGRFAFGFQ